ncbi:MAG: PDZ domain-containing protein [Candidatus Neomarinimicrobiota bacterium]
MTKAKTGVRVTDIIFVTGLMTGLLLLPSEAFSQEEEEAEESLETEEVVGEYDQEIDLGVMKVPPMPLVVPMLAQQRESRREVRPRFGLHIDDMDFQDAYEAHYPENYGVLIEGVVRGGSADLASLREGDIIMEFDGEKVRYEDHLLRMRNARSIGDTVEIKFFRDEKVMTTDVIFYSQKAKVDEFGEVPAEVGKRLSPGYGGGGFEPYFIDFDFKGINKFLKANKFDAIPGGLVVAWGGGGMGNVGKGWFIGGAGGGFEKRQQISVEDDQGQVGWKAYKLETAFGGVTLQKKVPLFTDRFVLDVGVLLGGGGTTLSMSQTNGDVTWGENIAAKNSYSVRFEKGYFVYRPSVGLLVRIKNWVGVHGSVGYLGTYAGDDKWTEKPFDFTVEGVDSVSPAVPSGPTFSLGFWFGY